MVGDKSDQVSKVGDVVWFLCYYFVENGVDGVYYIDIFMFVMIVDIVGFVVFVFGCYFVQCMGMVFNIQLVMDLFFVVIYWQWFICQGIKDSQWDQFFWEVIWIIVVGVVGYYYWQVVGVVSGVNQMVVVCFGGGVWVVWCVWGFFGEQVIGVVQVVVYFIGGDVVEVEGLFLCFFKVGLVVMGCFQQSEGVDYVGLDEGCWVINGMVYMVFCCQVYYDIWVEFVELGGYGSSICDISLGK